MRQPQANTSDRPGVVLVNIQILRFIAASAIVLSHTADLLLPRTSWLWVVPWTAGVDVFFVISGFIMAHLTQGQFGRSGAARGFLLRRLIRIVPAYWFFTVLLALIILASGGRIRNSVPSLDVLITSLAFIPWPRIDGKINPLLAQGWSLNFEMMFYLAFAAALCFRNGKALLAGGLALLAASHWLVPESWFALHFWSRPIIVEFIIGMGMAYFHAAGWRMKGPMMVATLACAALLYGFAPPPHGNEYLRLVKVGIPSALFAAVFIFGRESTGDGPVRRVLAYGGDASYAIYLSHSLTMAAFIEIWRKLPIAAPWLGVICAMLAALAGGLVFHRLTERPVSAMLKRRLATWELRGQTVAASPPPS